MKTLRIYVDTSVVGGCFDPEFARWSNGLMETFRQGRFKAVLSDVTESEVSQAPERVRRLWDELVPAGEIVATTAVVEALVDAYLAHGILGPRWRNDLLQIALATIAGADALVSWNFKHIVRQDLIPRFNAVNLEHGYGTLAIYSPREAMHDGQDATDPRGTDGPANS